MNSIRNILFILLGFFLLNGCYNDITRIELPEDIGPVSFQGDVMTIFNNNCNSTGCHSAGANAPDLSPANAWQSLTEGSYVAISYPELSLLYKRISGTTAGPIMPTAGRMSARNLQVILAWIEQGAKNN